MGSLFHPFWDRIFAWVCAAELGPGRASALLSAAQLLPLPNFHNNSETARGVFFPLLILAMIDAVEAEHYLCKMTSEVTAEFDALTFPKQAVYTGSAVYPEFDNISLKLLVLWFCGYKFQFSSLFPVKTFSSDKQIDHQKEQF